MSNVKFERNNSVEYRQEIRIGEKQNIQGGGGGVAEWLGCWTYNLVSRVQVLYPAIHLVAPSSTYSLAALCKQPTGLPPVSGDF